MDIPLWSRRCLAAAFDTLLPRACAVCGAPLPPLASAGGPLCAACAGGLRPIGGRRCPRCGDELVSEEGECMDCRKKERSIDEASPLFRFSGPFKSVLTAYKFRDRRSFAPFLARLVADEATSRWPGWPIVPVPPRPGKLRERGWDQVEDIARELERQGFRVLRVLERLPSRQQKRLGRAARRENASMAYRLRPGAAPPELALLLDDVVTTGATADACAAALKGGGAKRVALVALAAD